MLIQDVKENVENLAKNLISQGKIFELDNNYLSKKYYDELLAAQAASAQEMQNLYQSETFTKGIEDIKNICMSHRWQLITIDELRSEMNLQKDIFTKIIQAMKQSKELALIPEGYILISELEDEMLDILRNIGTQVTLAQVRDATGSTRKFILPILEYFDSKGYTRRAGDYRVVL